MEVSMRIVARISFLGAIGYAAGFNSNIKTNIVDFRKPDMLSPEKEKIPRKEKNFMQKKKFRNHRY